MLHEKEWVTTKESKGYLWIGQIESIENDIAKCLFNDVDSCFKETYKLSELRHYSTKEMADDIFEHFNEEEPSIFLYSAEYIKWLKDMIRLLEEHVEDIRALESTIDDPDYDNLTSEALWEIDHTNEFIGMLQLLLERMEDSKINK